MVEALTRAAAEPSGLPLYMVRGQPGLFPRKSTGEAAARRCQDEGLIALTPEQRAVITERGRKWLAEWSNPRQVIEDFLRVLERKQGQVAELASAAQQMAVSLDALRQAVEHWIGESPRLAQSHHAAPQSEWSGPRGVAEGLLAILSDWPGQAGHDCSLAELYRRLKSPFPSLSIGQFHDTLRQLHAEGRIYLHPWTGPLYEMPEPALALLVGHLIAFYVSPRRAPQAELDVPLKSLGANPGRG
jgi:hypothetical protein